MVYSFTKATLLFALVKNSQISKILWNFIRSEPLCEMKEKAIEKDC